MRHDLTVLVVGSGAREHVLYSAIERSPLVARVLCTPGNGGIFPDNRRNIKESDFDGLVCLVKNEKVDLVVVGPEVPLVAGLVDRLEGEGIAAFGPSAKGALLEGSKIFMKTRCRRWGVPTADFDFAGDCKVAKKIIERNGFRVVKADGLCGGKGVIVAETENEALEATRRLLTERVHGNAGARIVLETRLKGTECSVMAFCDGENAVLLPPARDYKRACNDDVGPNTGGMGSYAPSLDVDESLLDTIKEQIILPTLRGMADWGVPYRGVLYAGIMLTSEGPQLLEYNVRFGDPECQVILPLLDSDVVEYILATLEAGGLSQLGQIKAKPEVAVCTILVSKGYPNKYQVGFPITGVEEASRSALIFHAGTDRTPDLVTSGGRVMSVVGFGENVALARARSRAAADAIQFVGKFYRTDIAV